MSVTFTAQTVAATIVKACESKAVADKAVAAATADLVHAVKFTATAIDKHRVSGNAIARETKARVAGLPLVVRSMAPTSPATVTYYAATGRVMHLPGEFLDGIDVFSVLKITRDLCQHKNTAACHAAIAKSKSKGEAWAFLKDAQNVMNAPVEPVAPAATEGEDKGEDKGKGEGEAPATVTREQMLAQVNESLATALTMDGAWTVEAVEMLGKIISEATDARETVRVEAAKASAAARKRKARKAPAAA